MPGLALYDVSVGTFTKALNVLLNILNKAEAYAQEKGVDVDSYAATALCEDMKPLSFQIQVASNTVKKSLWRLTGDEGESWDDNETTIEQLKARVQKTLDLTKTVDADKINGKEDNNVELYVSVSVPVPVPFLPTPSPTPTLHKLTGRDLGKWARPAP